MGGLKMTNIDNHIIAMKCSWIKRIFTGGQMWIHLFTLTFGEDSVNSLYDMGDYYIQKLINETKNKFWNDVLVAWKLFLIKQMHSFNNSTEITLVPVWLNSDITINNVPIFKRDWYASGIKYVIDFIDESGNLLSKTEFETKFNIIVDVMYYNSIKSAISSFLKKIGYTKESFKCPEYPFVPSLLKNILLQEKCSKYVYDVVNKDKNLKPTSFEKWEKDLSFLNEIPLSKDAFKICFFVTEDTSIQWFQYKILHRILPIKAYLKTIGIKSSDSCWFCDEKEDITHAFVTCQSISQLWVNLSYHIYTKTSNRIGFNFKNIIFGESHSKRNIPINFIILYTKSFIYKCSRQEKIVQVNSLLRYIYFHYKIQKISCNKEP